MGKKKKTSSEQTDLKNKRTEKDKEATTTQASTNQHPHDPHQSTSPRLTTLEVILDGIKASPLQWPKEALRAILRKFERMPRKGWDLMHKKFLFLFKNEISLMQFKKRAEAAVLSNAGRKCSRSEFADENTKKRKTMEDFIEENTLSDLKLYNRVRSQLLNELGNIKSMKVEEVPRTKKISSDRQDGLLLEALNESLAEVIVQQPVRNWSDIAHMLQAVQLAYQALTTKTVKKSTWKEDIEEKIKEANISRDLLSKAMVQPLTASGELKQARKVMRQLGLVLDSRDGKIEAISKLTERAEVYQRKIDTCDKRRDFAKKNREFEVHRSQYYRDLNEETAGPIDVKVEDVKDFWSTMWNSTEENQDDFSEYLREYIPDEKQQKETFPSYLEFQEIIKYLPPWKAAGVDGIYNFFIKKCTSLHISIYNLIRETCMGKTVPEEWFYKGITYLIPKGTPVLGSDFRPITCMSNLYKVTTKCVTAVMQLIVEQRSLIAENQLGTVRMVQGAKEQAMINIALNKAAKNSLKTMWIDVKKAFDSVDHTYLIKCIESLNFPPWISSFLKGTIKRWKLDIRLENKTILEKEIKKGILQGDSLSPLLFVLVMDPLSRKLNCSYPKVATETGSDQYVTNHLLFIDDLKLFAEKEEVLEKMMEEVNKFFKAVGLERNRSKSATNCEACESSAVILGPQEGYKYLGVTENRESKITRETYEKVRSTIAKRVESICKSGLNGKNTITAINEYALSVMNYYIGAIPLEHDDYLRIDDEVRKILVRHKVHLQPANTERLYLPRKELGRGLCNIVFKSEKIQLALFKTLDDTKHTSLRRAAILKTMQEENNSLAIILEYLAIKYNTKKEEINNKSLEDLQKKSLYSDIKQKSRHEKLYRARENELVDIENSSIWLSKGNISVRDEAYLCYLQDRNMFGGAPGLCPHCKERTKSVDHLATQCSKMLGHDYTRRHNEIVKCLHLLLCNKYGIKRSKRLRTHSVQEISANKDVEIRVDTTIATSTRQSANRPDLVIHDKKRKEITIIEVGVTSQDQLQIVENEKRRKYDVLAKEMGAIHGCKTTIIPYVITWDGIVTKFHKKYTKDIGITDKIEAYIRFITLKKTLESISFDYRREGDETVEENLEIIRLEKVDDDENVAAVVETGKVEN